jgi:ABC-type transport system substrate-binding protein
MALSLDRRAFIDILGEGHGDIGGAMEPPPAGRWGLPLEILKTLPGYDPDMPKNRAEARRIMERLGYGPDKPLAIRVSARNIPPTRDPAVILIDQLREIYVSGELEPVDTAQWYPKVMRKDHCRTYRQTSGVAGIGIYLGRWVGRALEAPVRLRRRCGTVRSKRACVGFLAVFSLDARSSEEEFRPC